MSNRKSHTYNYPNKSLGQHWLKNNEVLLDIIACLELSKEATVVEIGPGEGYLTKHLCVAAKKVIAVELDSVLAKQLSNRINHAALEVVNRDIRTFNFTNIPSPYYVVGNIPYYLTSHLTRQLMQLPTPPYRIVLLVQKEVAQRMAAGPGSMSVLSVMCQLYSTVSLGRVVEAAYFEPPPKVDSQVVIFDPLPKEHVRGDVEGILRVVKAGFGERRKKLINSLAGGLALDKSHTQQAVRSVGLKDNVRAQELSIEQWVQLHESLL